jgi:hypothetical protein
MLPLNHKRTKSYFAPPIFYEAKKLQLKDRKFPKKATKMIQTNILILFQLIRLVSFFMNFVKIEYETKRENFGGPPKGILGSLIQEY